MFVGFSLAGAFLDLATLAFANESFFLSIFLLLNLIVILIVIIILLGARSSDRALQAVGRGEHFPPLVDFPDDLLHQALGGGWGTVDLVEAWAARKRIEEVLIKPRSGFEGKNGGKEPRDQRR